MRKAVDLLVKHGWQRSKDFDSTGVGCRPRPLLTKGDWKAIVGKDWVTVYQLLRATCVGRMVTLAVDDAKLRRVAEDPDRSVR